MGAHLCLLKGCPGNEQAHKAQWSLASMPFNIRHEARLLQRGNPYLQQLFAKERPPRGDELGGEPPGLW